MNENERRQVRRASNSEITNIWDMTVNFEDEQEMLQHALSAVW